ncbi:MAG: nucleotide exchange factor GrpE [Promethearchaeota archaeon]|nr:MAG: nucleotide exchange factor GrpE [Candidatus Lokiarchaeota archaeon]
MTDDNNDELKEESKPEVSVDSKTFPTEHQENADTKTESQEIKKLEEKEHYELDYFLKEDLIKEKEDLEKEFADLKENVEKLQKENADSKKKFMHLQAEFENAQKRWDKNRQNLRIEYTASVLKSFLPLYDSFKKAIDSANDTEKNVLNGFYNQFMNIFKSFGAEPIQVSVNDQFDYNVHEALTTVEKEDIPENIILEIVQDGFKYGKEVIRYAKVIISRKPKPPEPKPEEKEVEVITSEKEEVEEDITEKKELEEKNSKEKKLKKHKKEKDKKSS